MEKNLNSIQAELVENIKKLNREKQTFINDIDSKIKNLESELKNVSSSIHEIQKPKFITDIRYADYVCVLMKDGSKKFTKDYSDLNIERELNSDEYIEFLAENGFKVGAKISHWNNSPLFIMEIIKGSSGYVQPTFKRNTNPTPEFPDGSYAQLYDHKLVVETPTEFWHYNFKK